MKCFDPQKRELNEILKDGLLRIALSLWAIVFVLIIAGALG